MTIKLGGVKFRGDMSKTLARVPAGGGGGGVTFSYQLVGSSSVPFVDGAAVTDVAFDSAGAFGLIVNASDPNYYVQLSKVGSEFVSPVGLQPVGTNLAQAFMQFAMLDGTGSSAGTGAYLARVYAGFPAAGAPLVATLNVSVASFTQVSWNIASVPDPIVGDGRLLAFDMSGGRAYVSADAWGYRYGTATIDAGAPLQNASAGFWGSGPAVAQLFAASVNLENHGAWMPAAFRGFPTLATGTPISGYGNTEEVVVSLVPVQQGASVVIDNMWSQNQGSQSGVPYTQFAEQYEIGDAVTQFTFLGANGADTTVVKFTVTDENGSTSYVAYFKAQE